MLPRLSSLVLACLIYTSAINAASSRQGRADASPPIEKAADAPLNDNIAVASDSEVAAVKVAAPAEVVENNSVATPAAATKEAATEQPSNSTDESPAATSKPGSMDECDQNNVGFELITGYVFSAPSYLINSIPETLLLSDCLDACQMNDSCSSVNFETGLCVLFSSNADIMPGALLKSQFPVFTIYAQKTCFTLSPCDKPWCIDRVQGYRLNGYVRRTAPATSRIDCFEMCLGETDFQCRSANYQDGTCELSDMDRTTLSGMAASNVFSQVEGANYLENNCIEEPKKLCEFKRLSGKILKTVDSVYMDVGSIEECRDLCLNSPYRCRSYDYQETGSLICRLSHHNRATLFDIEAPYLDVPEASSYELSACYNVTIECKSSEMVARIQTSRLFSGKVYSKGAPNSCAVDANNSLDIDLHMAYNNLECNVRQGGSGLYMTDVIIQHHDTIITSSDLGLAVTCQYDLTNITVVNDAELGIFGDLEPALYEDVIVDSPNVIMKITQRDGNDLLDQALVGDPLALRFEIVDENSPYEISIRELVAMDGVDSGEITLIDSRGCPTDYFIMGPVYRSLERSDTKTLLTNFDAFKFPSSDIVQFRALVTPCMPACEPVMCDGDETNGELRTASYGRKRRSVAVNATLTRHRRDTKHQLPEDMLLVQSIHITDKFGFEKQQQAKGKSANSETVFIASDTQGMCVNGLGLIVASTVFLLAQLVVIAIWTFLHQRRRKHNQFDGTPNLGQTIQAVQSLPGSRTDSMCKLYESGYTGRNF